MTSASDNSQTFDLGRVFAELKRRGEKLPPVHLWNPAHCGPIDMRIARDGTWFYLGTPIGRAEMVRLFSTIIRFDPDGCYYLVTPVEKCLIKVEDAPFLAVELLVEGAGRDQVLTFRTNVDDVVTAGPAHPIRVGVEGARAEPAPYLHVRANLEARINRPVFYQLVDIATDDPDLPDGIGVWSQGQFFPLGQTGLEAP